MGLFSKILEKLGFGHSQAQAGTTPDDKTATAAPSSPTTAGTTTTTAQPQAIGVVDVVAKLEGLAANHPEKLNWKVSIVDLLKLLGLDSSLSARQELAKELGCPQEKLSDSAQMNTWLHKTVLQKLADNGGNIPADLLH
ncbi:DUF3597 domain-containing protein [Pseudomonas sp. RIT-PI-AD]|uniref:DUF3597 domain-containing protein n=1 Tax=Pseudomonas sp. RIT-PI-AD TaxID=3035294 RepID=UPI0021D8ABB4|nr:DUF3597 domain-containing protein [Pseudomonas sp. RIT-PI-AD]